MQAFNLELCQKQEKTEQSYLGALFPARLGDIWIQKQNKHNQKNYSGNVV